MSGAIGFRFLAKDNSRGLFEEVKRLFAVKGEKYAVVAYVGKGALQWLGNFKDVILVCNAESPATNPAELKKMLKKKGKNSVPIKTLSSLHSKIFLSNAGAIVGSANLSCNGLREIGFSKAISEEACVFVPKGTKQYEEILDYCRKIYEHKESVCITQAHIDRLVTFRAAIVKKKNNSEPKLYLAILFGESNITERQIRAAFKIKPNLCDIIEEPSLNLESGNFLNEAGLIECNYNTNGADILHYQVQGLAMIKKSLVLALKFTTFGKDIEKARIKKICSGLKEVLGTDDFAPWNDFAKKISGVRVASYSLKKKGLISGVYIPYQKLDAVESFIKKGQS